MMSNLHKIISNSNIKDEMKNDDFNPKIIFDEVESQRKEAIKDNSEFSSFYLEYADKLLTLLKNAVYPSLPKYPLHRDINPENVIFIKDKLMGVIDFDNVSIFDEPLVKDIVNLFLYSCYKEDDKTILDMGLAEHFICAYSKIRSLSNEEIENIPILAVFGILEDVNYEYWLYLNEPQRTSLEKIERRYKTGLWYYENSKIIIELLKKGLAK